MSATGFKFSEAKAFDCDLRLGTHCSRPLVSSLMQLVARNGILPTNLLKCPQAADSTGKDVFRVAGLAPGSPQRSAGKQPKGEESWSNPPVLQSFKPRKTLSSVAYNSSYKKS